MKSPRILITRLSAIGDCILTMPLAVALRAAFPDAEIFWVAEPAGAQLLEGHPAVDQVVRVNKGWMKRPAEWWSLRRRLRDLNCQIAIDPQSLTKSSMLGWLSGARTRIGFARPRGREAARLLNNRRIQATQRHVVDLYLELLKPLGIPRAQVRFDVPICAEAEAQVAAFLGQHELNNGFAVINPGAGWASKTWPADRFGEVAARIGTRQGCRSVVVWAGDQEQGWAREIVSGSQGHAILAPATSLKQLAALLNRCSWFLGSDTGPLHLAAAVGKPCVGLYGPTLPEVCGPYGDGHLTIKGVSRTEVGMRQAGADSMASIDVAAVLAACEQVDRRARSARAA